MHEEQGVLDIRIKYLCTLVILLALASVPVQVQIPDPGTGGTVGLALTVGPDANASQMQV